MCTIWNFNSALSWVIDFIRTLQVTADDSVTSYGTAIYNTNLWFAWKFAAILKTISWEEINVYSCDSTAKDCNFFLKELDGLPKILIHILHWWNCLGSVKNSEHHARSHFHFSCYWLLYKWYLDHRWRIFC